jgi:endonuclease YncB( thermonuclease family)
MRLLPMHRPGSALSIFAIGLALGMAVAGLAGRAGPGGAVQARSASPKAPVQADVPAPPGSYAATVVRVIDGDTFVARVPIWPGQEVTVRVRIAGIDAPELHSRCAEERAAAAAAGAALRDLVGAGAVTLVDVRPDKYFGRVDAEVRVGGRSAGAQLLADGHAVAYDGGRRRRCRTG